MNIFKKISQVLQIVGLLFFFILIKVWYLSVIKIEEKKIEAKRPQIKTIMQHANRGTIYDRYQLPLTVNRIKYNACVYYTQIRQLPMALWEKDLQGKKIKTFPRKTHIKNLANLLAKELNLNPEKTEDLIHAKASLLPHVPFVIKENISEKEYYKLRMLERNWIGLHAEITPERFYPQGRVASDLIGYMGAISQEKYMSIAKEISFLEDLLQQGENNKNLSLKYSNLEEVEKRLFLLKERAYSVNDLVGKTGLETLYDEKLRGFHGKKSFEVDIKGNFLKELSSSKKPKNGEKLISSISSELQNFAESLLAKDEKHRDDTSLKYNKKKKQMDKQKLPLLKGGAIIVMDPLSGEILTCASYPRFNPNDFIPSSNKNIRLEKQKNILKWLESKNYIANIFDGKETLKRELFDNKKGFYEEAKKLTQDYFLELILPKESLILSCLENIKNIKNAITLQEDVEALLYYAQIEDANKLFDSIFTENEGHILTKERLSPSEKTNIILNLYSHQSHIERPLQNLHLFLKNVTNNKDKILIINLLRLFVFSPAFSDNLIQTVGLMDLKDYWNTTKALLCFENKLSNTIKPLFYEYVFKKWREEHQSSFLKQKREEEKQRKIFPRPYLDYLDKMENALFNEFWQQKKWVLLSALIKEEKLADSSLALYMKVLKKKYAQNSPALDLLKKTFLELNFDQTYDFIKTVRSFKELERPLLGKKLSLAQTEKNLASAFYPKNGFGYCRSQAYRQSAPLGSVFKIAIAYSALKKHYLSLDNPPAIINPLTMVDKIAWDRRAKKGGGMVVGYTEDNRPYPRYYKGGRLPKSAHANIGKIDIIQALAQSSNPYFAILAGDFFSDPQDLLLDIQNLGFGSKTGIDLPGEIKGFLPNDLLTNKTGLYSFSIGQHSLIATPLQTAVMLSAIVNGGEILKPQILKKEKEVLRTLFLPAAVKNAILEGLDQTVWGEKGGARASVIKKLKQNPSSLKLFNELKHKMVGKTSTAEIMHKEDVSQNPAEKYKHIWFGGIYFEKEKNWDKPELVVVVYLRFGDGGKEAAPLAAEIIHKYKELKELYKK